MTKEMTKSSKVNQRMSSRCSRRNQEQFKTHEEKLKNTSRFKKKDEFKNQDSRIKLQESRSRFKIQDSRIKRRLNQAKSEKFFSKIE